MTREEAINEIQNMRKFNYTLAPGEVFDMAIKALEQLPKTGHWIHFALGDDCSECGWSTGKYISPSKYCPNCGAKMESEDKDE